LANNLIIYDFLPNKRLKKYIIISLMITILTYPIIYNPTLIKAKTIIVPIDYSDIQTALNNASDGDIITVLKGTYHGFEIKKSVTIIGENNQTVIITGKIIIYANNVKISSMKIILKNPSSSVDSAITILGTNTLLGNLIIESDISGIEVGDMDHSYATASIEHTTIIAGKEKKYLEPVGIWGVCESLYIFYTNITNQNGSGIAGCKYTQLMFSTINAGNTGIRASGEIKNSIILASNTGATLTGDTLIESSTIKGGNIGIDIQSNRNTINKNIISGSNIGIRIAGNDNTIRKNKINSGGHAIELVGNNNIIINNTLSGGRGINGLNAYGNTIAFNLINKTGNIGIYMSKYTENNNIYGNTFWYCYNYNAADESGKNQWYLENETLKMGNYWYDHTSPDNNKDGIVDTPYSITTTTGLQIIDKYPLTKPTVEFAWETTPTLTSSTMTTKTSVSPTPHTSSPITTSSASQSTTSTGAGTSISSYLIGLIVLLIIMGVALLILRKRH